MNKEFTIKIFAGDSGLLFGTSPDERGLLAIGHNAEEVVADAVKGLIDLTKFRRETRNDPYE